MNINTDFIFTKPLFQADPTIQGFEPSNREVFTVVVSKNLAFWLREKAAELGFVDGPAEMTQALLNRYYKADKSKGEVAK